ncbi:hypothetical protein MXD62_26535 [Frankia sp. Mgl5]|uniref:hypothetical protein n=1 Tax=Frankia sp. Mgl5 TaxID=2933793 RepID=UPI00200F2F83|nr:hypothetical protein [Frankia sp. Mgl5]MCK9930673.1 hypothetical protein [Frankia sp. Mgl5]
MEERRSALLESSVLSLLGLRAVIPAGHAAAGSSAVEAGGDLEQQCEGGRLGGRLEPRPGSGDWYLERAGVLVPHLIQARIDRPAVAE